MSKLKVNELDTKTGTTITVAAGKTLAGTDIIGSTQIAANAVDTSELAADAVTANEIEAGAVGATEMASTLNLSAKTVSLPQSTVTDHVTPYDDAALRNDIATLALHSAIADNKAAYNLSNSFIDQFEDDTGIDNETDTDRNSGEYVSSISGLGGLDSYTKLLMHMDNVDGGTTITDSSARNASTVVAGNVHADATIKKFGTASTEFDGSGDYTTTGGASPGHTDYCLENTMDWTVDYWFYDRAPASGWGRHLGQAKDNGAYNAWHIGHDGSTTQLEFGHDSSGQLNLLGNTNIAANTWYHLCLEYDQSANTTKMWLNGVLDATTTNSSNSDWTWHNSPEAFLMGRTNPGGSDLNGFLDEVRISKGICRTQDPIDPLYISSGTGFTPPTAQYDARSVNATGSFSGVTQTAVSSVSTMGIVVLYKNEEGTATLNTDLVAEVSANNGTNWSNATLVAGGTFSAGINIAAVSGVSVTAGTAPKYRISFANQVSGSKETRVHGVSLQY